MRLIDADALIEHLRKDPLFCMVERYGIEGVIDNAPTIEPSGDLIGRQEAIEIIASHDETNGTEKVFTGREITDLLASLPSTDTCDRPKGEWLIIDFDLTPFNYEGFYCSNCRHIYDYKMNFCPHCGAEMK